MQECAARSSSDRVPASQRTCRPPAAAPAAQIRRRRPQRAALLGQALLQPQQQQHVMQRSLLAGAHTPCMYACSWHPRRQHQQPGACSLHDVRGSSSRRTSSSRICSSSSSSSSSSNSSTCDGSLHSPGSSHRSSSGSGSSSRAVLRPPGASLALVDPAAASTSALSAAAAVAIPLPSTTGAATAGGLAGLSQVVAVVLGYCVMIGSLFRSVPQIVKVVQHNSTEGLSLTSYIVELCCYSVVIAYNVCQGYQFNTFGEVVACWLQDVILVALVFRDRRTPLWAVGGTAAALAAGCAFLLSPACPAALLASLQASNIAIMALGSRLPQILLNMKRGNAGMLSVTTCVLNVLGNAARIFTTLVLTGDLLMLGGACSQGCLNAILLWQSVATARSRGGTAVPAAAPAGDGAATPPAAAASGSSSSSSSSKPGLRQRSEPEPPAGGLAPLLHPAS